MAYKLLLNESVASRMCVPMWLVGSNGTTPAASESGATFFFSIGGADYGSGGSISAVSAGGGFYSCNFSASKLSVQGPGFVYYRSATALPSCTPIEVVPYNSYDSMRLGLFAVPNAAAQASGGLITVGTGAGQLNVSAGSVGILAATHSGVTIQGISNYGNISNVTIAAGLYSSVTVRLDLQTYSGATVGVNNIAAGTYSGATVEVSNVGRASMQSQADRILLRGLASGADTGRTVQDAFRPLRNRVTVGASIMTVYSEDDVTSAWTASVTTSASAFPITDVNPAGGSA